MVAQYKDEFRGVGHEADLHWALIVITDPATLSGPSFQVYAQRRRRRTRRGSRPQTQPTLGGETAVAAAAGRTKAKSAAGEDSARSKPSEGAASSARARTSASASADTATTSAAGPGPAGSRKTRVEDVPEDGEGVPVQGAERAATPPLPGTASSAPAGASTMTAKAQEMASRLERTGLCVICQDEEANIAIVDCGCVFLPSSRVVLMGCAL